MKKLKCSQCNYEFRLKNPEQKEIPDKCPYCNTVGSVSEKRHILEEL